MKITKEPYTITVVSNSGFSHLTLSLYNPFREISTPLLLHFMNDKAIPGFEFSFSLIFFYIFYRKNKPEAVEYLNSLQDEIETNKLNTL